ncbi:m154.3 protein [Murid betaherpesvirus 1]|nr:m154.3 protein [Murid betaherpesvirus 1]
MTTIVRGTVDIWVWPLKHERQYLDDRIDPDQNPASARQSHSRGGAPRYGLDHDAGDVTDICAKLVSLLLIPSRRRIGSFGAFGVNLLGRNGTFCRWHFNHGISRRY